MTTTDLAQLRRVRWAVRATLLFGVAASVAANVLHANPNPISQSIAAWPPLALLLTVELVSRIPVHRRSLAAVRVLATAIIAGIAAWVSYWHMQGVASRYGETDASPYLLPVSVDGLIVVASICLVELAGRIRHQENPSTTQAPLAPTPLVAAGVTVSNGHKPADPSGPTAPALAGQPERVAPAISAPSRSAPRRDEARPAAAKAAPWAAPPPRPRTN